MRANLAPSLFLYNTWLHSWYITMIIRCMYYICIVKFPLIILETLAQMLFALCTLCNICLYLPTRSKVFPELQWINLEAWYNFARQHNITMDTWIISTYTRYSKQVNSFTTHTHTPHNGILRMSTKFEEFKVWKCSCRSDRFWYDMDVTVNFKAIAHA